MEGEAAEAVGGKLAVAASAVQRAQDAGKNLDSLADRGAGAVDSAIGDIAGIAQDCLQEVVSTVTSSMVSPGALMGVVNLQVLPIVEKHRARALARLQSLGLELEGLTGEIRNVHIPARPDAPIDAGGVGGSGGSTGAGSSVARTLGALAGAEGMGGAASSADQFADKRDGFVDASHEAGGDVAGAPSPQAAAAVSAAKTALGTPYQWGGTTPGVGMDCSGFTQWAYAQAGVDIPRTADAQAVGTSVSMDNALPGDLVVWDGHVAMVVENGQMIEAGDPVQINPLRTENIGMNFLGVYRPTA